MNASSRLNILGVDVDVVTSEQVMDFVARRAGQNVRTVIANHNLHSISLCRKSSRMRSFYRRADLIEIDSTPLIAWGRLLGYDLSTAYRSTYLDFRDDFWTMAQEKGWRVWHIGGRPEHIELSRNHILQRYPDVQLTVHSGYFDVNGPENDTVIEKLTADAPDVVLVGMGMPRQELWIENNYHRLPNAVILPVGGAFDYEAGVTYTPPRWTGQVGLEWLVRFAHDPLRLFERYFVEPWSLVPSMMRDLVRSTDGRARQAVPDAAPDASRQLDGAWRVRIAPVRPSLPARVMDRVPGDIG